MITVVGCVAMSSAEQVYDATDYGAVPDGQTLCTTAIQKAIDKCSLSGGGVVQLSGGKFLSGTIFMKSGVTLKIVEGSTLLASTNMKHYPSTPSAYRTYTENYTDKSLIYGENLTNIAITGKGSYDGQGQAKIFKNKNNHDRPYGIRFVSCTNVLIENITLRNSPMWMQHYLACDNLTIRAIRVWNHCNKNNDGMDIDGCHKVLIEDCLIDSHDDAICLKSTSARACEDVTIRKCTTSSCSNAIKCGTESSGGFKNVKISDCVIKTSDNKYEEVVYHKKIGTGNGGLALEIVDGGTMDQISISNISIKGTTAPIFIRLGNRARKFRKDMPTPEVGKMSNVTISNVQASGTTAMGCAIVGLTDHPIENLTLKNITISFPGGGEKEDTIRRFEEKETAGRYPECKMFARKLPAYGFYFWHVKNLKLENIKLTTVMPDERPAIALENASNVLIDGKAVTSGAQDLPQGVVLNKVPKKKVNYKIIPF